jgi:tripartite-type tricarboxylate transporter receptor subunit TctC
MTTRRKLLKLLAAGAVSSATTKPVLAADWPQRPVRVIVPFAAGGNTDGIARLMAQHYSERLGQAFVVENRVGAGGIMAADMTARSAPDGYTLMMAALPQIAILPAMRRTNYDPVADFTPIVNIASNPFCLVTNPQFEPTTLAQFVTYVKARPGKVAYASGGTGSVSHLTMVLLCQRAGLEMVHVPYKGGAPAIADVIGNQVPMYFGNLSEGLPHVGQDLRALVVSGAKRTTKLPDVPTVAESGYPNFRSETWNGLVGPAKLPTFIGDILVREAKIAVKDKSILQLFDSYGVDALASDSAEFKRTIAQDIAQWQTAIKEADIKI